MTDQSKTTPMGPGSCPAEYGMQREDCDAWPACACEPPIQKSTDIVARLRETLTGEDTDEAMWRRIAAERAEAANTIHALRVKLHRERSKVGMLIADRRGQK
jgi:hypothetical protein